MKPPALAEMSEAEWQQQLIDLAHALGWKHMFVRKSIGKGKQWTTATNVPGWPDLFLWSERQQRVMFVELKSETGTASEKQVAVLRSLAAAGQEVHIWRPSDLDNAHRALKEPS